MPFLRVIRDKRGYEITYLMHVYREGPRQQTRILYAFRTPGGVRVGRDALEPDVLKQIEAQYPDIDFDWSVVFQTRQVIESGVEPRRPRRRSSEEGPIAAAEPRAPVATPQQPSLPAIPAVIEGLTPDERIGFLAHWYPIVRQRIQRIGDAGRRDPLLAVAERLNPATWTDVDQITAGLVQAADALDRLSHVLARRRRRSKKRSTSAADVTSPSAVVERAGESMPDAAEPLSEDADVVPEEPTPDA